MHLTIFLVILLILIIFGILFYFTIYSTKEGLSTIRVNAGSVAGPNYSGQNRIIPQPQNPMNYNGEYTDISFPVRYNVAELSPLEMQSIPLGEKAWYPVESRGWGKRYQSV